MNDFWLQVSRTRWRRSLADYYDGPSKEPENDLEVKCAMYVFSEGSKLVWRTKSQKLHHNQIHLPNAYSLRFFYNPTPVFEILCDFLVQSIVSLHMDYRKIRKLC